MAKIKMWKLVQQTDATLANCAEEHLAVVRYESRTELLIRRRVGQWAYDSSGRRHDTANLFKFIRWLAPSMGSVPMDGQCFMAHGWDGVFWWYDGKCFHAFGSGMVRAISEQLSSITPIPNAYMVLVEQGETEEVK